jgi:hypothetical protein
VYVDHPGAKRTAQSVNLRLDPNSVDDDVTVFWEVLNLLGDCLGDPLALCPAVKDVASVLKSTALRLDISNGFDQLSGLEGMKSVFLDQRLGQRGLARSHWARE